MVRYFQLVGDREYHPEAFLVAVDHTRAVDAVAANLPYPDAFSANLFAPDDLCFVDYVVCAGGLPVVSRRFKEAVESASLHDLRFYEAIVLFGTENLMGWIGDEVGSLHGATYAHVVDVIDEGVDPVRYWPHLRRFKAETFVLARALPEGASVAMDPKRPDLTICTEDFKRFCEKAGLRVGFHELPTAVGLQRH